MIKIPKRLSFNKTPFAYLNKSLPFRITAVLFLFFLFYVFLPVYFNSCLDCQPLRLIIFYLANIFIAFLLIKNYFQEKYLLQSRELHLQERTNILGNKNSCLRKNQIAIQEKIKRYNGLKKILEDINQNLALEFIADALSDIVFSAIGSQRGTCLLYLVDNRTQKLKLFKAKKEDKEAVIKAKEGDIFDAWVLRHAAPLLIEDIHRDFRFDLEKFKKEDLRPISSLISAPFLSEHRLLGIARLDNQQPGAYSQEDLRFLVTISDLGAVALENGELFQKTQELATHDGLTSLYTKGYFLQRLKEEYEMSIRHKTDLSLLMLDIDYFKNYNDKFGHTVGDIVLQKLSLTMADFLKDFSPLVSRFGGEEFCAVLNLDKKKACAVTEGLRVKIEKTKIILRRQESSITVSIGVATLTDQMKNEEELILKADRACLEAKRKGRNRVICA